MNIMNSVSGGAIAVLGSMRAGVSRACAEVAHRILEEWLLEVSLYIFEQTIFVALAVPHFAKDFSILGYDALDCIVRAVRIVRRLHRDLIGERVYVLEGHLAVGEQTRGRGPRSRQIFPRRGLLGWRTHPLCSGPTAKANLLWKP